MEPDCLLWDSSSSFSSTQKNQKKCVCYSNMGPEAALAMFGKGFKGKKKKKRPAEFLNSTPKRLNNELNQ